MQMTGSMCLPRQQNAGVITHEPDFSMKRRVRIDLHVHSNASFDCSVGPEAVARRCERLGLGPIFLTDHDTLDGALRLKQLTGSSVVTGQEVTTNEGEVIGLFVQECIEPQLTALETVRQIKSQGGLVYLPHPLDPTRHSLSAEAIDSISGHLDIVEICNGRASPAVNRHAEELCHSLGAAAGGGSDAHSLDRVGTVYVQIEEFRDADDFLTKLMDARIVCRPNGLRLRLEAGIVRLTRGRPVAPAIR